MTGPEPRRECSSFVRGIWGGGGGARGGGPPPPPPPPPALWARVENAKVSPYRAPSPASIFVEPPGAVSPSAYIRPEQGLRRTLRLRSDRRHFGGVRAMAEYRPCVHHICRVLFFGWGVGWLLICWVIPLWGMPLRHSSRLLDEKFTSRGT